MQCRHCSNDSFIPFADLGSAPPSNSYLKQESLDQPEVWYPLRVLVCNHCWLAQTQDLAHRDELFSPDYAYFSSYSDSWLNHCKKYTDQMIRRFDLDERSLIGEIAANDGYLLQYFQQQNIPNFGIEPTISTAMVARQKGLNIIEKFFGINLANECLNKGYASDLLIANNVLAHVPDINDFIAGFRILLKPDGVATFEFPHLYQLLKDTQFDTIYHEHFSYLSLGSLQPIFEKNGLVIFDVEEIKTHGGSLRIYVQRIDQGRHNISPTVSQLISREKECGLFTETTYKAFQSKIFCIKQQLLEFLLAKRKAGEQVVAYGAAAKGNTLLNYAGVKNDLVSYVIDRNPHKQDKFLPGSRIPIKSETHLMNDRPKWIIILPWNLKDEIAQQLAYARDWGAQFITAIPTLNIH